MAFEGSHSILEEILTMGHLEYEEIMENLPNKIGDNAIEILFKQNHINIIPCLGVKHDPQQAGLILSDEINKLEIQRGLDAELEEVVNSSENELDETAFGELVRPAK